MRGPGVGKGACSVVQLCRARGSFYAVKKIARLSGSCALSADPELALLVAEYVGFQPMCHIGLNLSMEALLPPCSTHLEMLLLTAYY